MFSDIEWDELSRVDILNFLSNKIEDYFSDPKSIDWNVIFVDWEWWTWKTWLINKYVDCLESTIYEWKHCVVKYSAWHYLNDENLIKDFVLSINWWTSWSEWDYKILSTFALLSDFQSISFDVAENFLPSALEFIESNMDQCEWSELYLMFRTVKWIIDNNWKLKRYEKLHGIGKKINDIKRKYSKKNKPKDLFDSSNIIWKLKLKQKYLIVIDDLDRIDEKRLWRILSLVSLFAENDDILFVLLWSQSYLSSVLDKRYQVSEYSESFINKFISFKVSLPPFTKANIKEWILDILKNEYWIKIEQSFEEVLRWILEYHVVPPYLSYRDYKEKIYNFLIVNKNIFNNYFSDDISTIARLPVILFLWTKCNRFILNTFAEAHNNCHNTAYCNLVYHPCDNICKKIIELGDDPSSFVRIERGFIFLLSYLIYIDQWVESFIVEENIHWDQNTLSWETEIIKWFSSFSKQPNEDRHMAVGTLVDSIKSEIYQVNDQMSELIDSRSPMDSSDYDENVEYKIHKFKDKFIEEFVKLFGKLFLWK